MAVQLQQHMTVEEFDAWVLLPENAEHTYEFIEGEVYQVPSNPKVSSIAAIISGELYIYLKTHDTGHLTGDAGGFMVAEQRYAPDVAYISYARQPELAGKGYNPHPPELAVEVINEADNDVSDPDESRRLRMKIVNCLAAGVLVWVVNGAERLIEVYETGTNGRVLTENDTLTAENILPGFSVPVKDLFRSK